MAGKLLPLTDLHLDRIAELESLVGTRYRGWGQQPDGLLFVDILTPAGEGCARFPETTLHRALGAAIVAHQPPEVAAP